MNAEDNRSVEEYEGIDHSAPLYTIGIAAQLTGTTVSTIRMYEDKGLLIPHKTATGRRHYSDTDIIRLRCIRQHLDDQGLNIAGIRSLLAMVPCWLLRPCSEEDRQQCEAFTSNTSPCWDVSTKGPECRTADCRACPVYHLPDRCRDVKSLYKELMASSNMTAEPTAPTGEREHLSI